MKRSRISDNDDVNLDDLDANGGGGRQPAADPPADDADDDQDELPEGDDDPDDDADDDAEGDDADDGDEGDDDQDEPAAGRQQAAGADDQQGGRRNSTIRTLRAQLREARESSRTLTQRFDDFVARGGQQQRQQPQQTQETQEQRNARRSLLSAEERMSEDMQELRSLVVTSTHQTQVSTADATDRASFDAKSASDPLYRRWSAKVETERARLAGLGQFVAREAIMTFMIGKAALEARNSPEAKKQRAQANRRVQRQTVKAGSSRNDATQSRRGSSKSLEQRLADVPL